MFGHEMWVLTGHHVLKFLAHCDDLLAVAVLYAADFLLVGFYQVLHLLLVGCHSL